MPDTSQDRTEQPTPRRRREARQRGQIGKSADLTGSVVLLGGVIALYVFGQKILERLLLVTRGCFGGSTEVMTDAHQAVPTLSAAFNETVAMVLPVMLMVLVLALVTSFAQVGTLFTSKPVRPSLARLNPFTGLKRIFSGRSLVQLLMGIVKLSLLSLIAYWTLSSRAEVLAKASTMHHLPMLAVMAEVVFVLGLRLAVVLLGLGIIDFIYQRYRAEKDLKMTRQELKDELKRMEGDPQIKQKRREVQQQITFQRIQDAVPQADMVITSPRELAVVIKYDPETMTAPKVSGRGVYAMAQRIRELAIENGIPIVERKSLAHALYNRVRIGHEIPPGLYKEVAEMLAYVLELSDKGFTRPLYAGAAMSREY
ncbi:MAG: EscU/YscU/HrcU family type III secretion system export apparatus switch protein [Planctomycetota bacterium]|nr:MAG: EscU/YscU/HrcU family type III secretion system export apparatus switch protein [Planctomycetota bacterium]